MNGYGFRHAARMERIKLSSVRSTWWLAVDNDRPRSENGQSLRVPLRPAQPGICPDGGQP
jgi:hypothetical protein